MKKTALILLTIASTSSVAGPITASEQELRALGMGMQGMMERLADPRWIALAQEEKNGCWLDKNNLVPEGTAAEFEGVPSTCISFDLGFGDMKSFMFFPTRIKTECDKLGVAYDKCDVRDPK